MHCTKYACMIYVARRARIRSSHVRLAVVHCWCGREQSCMCQSWFVQSNSMISIACAVSFVGLQSSNICCRAHDLSLYYSADRIMQFPVQVWWGIDLQQEGADSHVCVATRGSLACSIQGGQLFAIAFVWNPCWQLSRSVLTYCSYSRIRIESWCYSYHRLHLFRACLCLAIDSSLWQHRTHQTC